MVGDQQVTRIILARHGDATYPSGTDSEAKGGTLTELGRGQARALANTLANQAVTEVVCSELSRARQTAEIVAEVLGLPVDVRPGLHEYRLGDDPYDIEALGSTLRGWLDGDLQARVLGGESGEDVAARILPVLDQLAHAHRGRTVLVVIHGGAIVATLGSIAPGQAGRPSGGDPHGLERDIGGGSFFFLEHRSTGWCVLPREDR